MKISPQIARQVKKLVRDGKSGTIAEQLTKQTHQLALLVLAVNLLDKALHKSVHEAFDLRYFGPAIFRRTKSSPMGEILKGEEYANHIEKEMSKLYSEIKTLRENAEKCMNLAGFER